jgi:hypothetical protein
MELEEDGHNSPASKLLTVSLESVDCALVSGGESSGSLLVRCRTPGSDKVCARVFGGGEWVSPSLHSRPSSNSLALADFNPKQVGGGARRFNVVCNQLNLR